jgi:hypothetical protein
MVLGRVDMAAQNLSKSLDLTAARTVVNFWSAHTRSKAKSQAGDENAVEIDLRVTGGSTITIYVADYYLAKAMLARHRQNSES